VCAGRVQAVQRRGGRGRIVREARERSVRLRGNWAEPGSYRYIGRRANRPVYRGRRLLFRMPQFVTLMSGVKLLCLNMQYWECGQQCTCFLTRQIVTLFGSPGNVILHKVKGI
jgi:hypothetical protein